MKIIISKTSEGILVKYISPQDKLYSNLFGKYDYLGIIAYVCAALRGSIE